MYTYPCGSGSWIYEIRIQELQDKVQKLEKENKKLKRKLKEQK